MLFASESQSCQRFSCNFKVEMQQKMQSKMMSSTAPKMSSNCLEKTVETPPLSLIQNSRRKLSDGTKRSLKTVDFNVWKWNHEELISFLEEMYHDLDSMSELHVKEDTIRTFLINVESQYNSNHFHNFRHAFCVAQMFYSAFVHGCHRVKKLLTKRELIVLLTACICHDLDHPGLSNVYQVNAGTDLARRYGNKSPLENHHLDVTMKILSRSDCNIFQHFGPEERQKIKAELRTLILATDMARHDEILRNFEEKLLNFDCANIDDLNNFKCMVIKACDISNECRPLEISEPWGESLLKEYFQQSDMERSSNLPVSPHMDRLTVTKATSQIGFIKFVLIPLFTDIKQMLDEIDYLVLPNLHKALEFYENLKRKTEMENDTNS